MFGSRKSYVTIGPGHLRRRKPRKSHNSHDHPASTYPIPGPEDPRRYQPSSYDRRDYNQPTRRPSPQSLSFRRDYYPASQPRTLVLNQTIVYHCYGTDSATEAGDPRQREAAAAGNGIGMPLDCYDDDTYDEIERHPPPDRSPSASHSPLFQEEFRDVQSQNTASFRVMEVRPEGVEKRSEDEGDGARQRGRHYDHNNPEVEEPESDSGESTDSIGPIITPFPDSRDPSQAPSNTTRHSRGRQTTRNSHGH